MKITSVKYTAQFDEYGAIKSQWVGLEAAIDDTETAESRLDEIKEITERWYRRQNPFLQPQGPPVYNGNSFPGPRIIETKQEDGELGVTVDIIMSCNNLKSLHEYKYPVRSSSKTVKEAYQNRERELMDVEELLKEKAKNNN